MTTPSLRTVSVALLAAVAEVGWRMVQRSAAPGRADSQAAWAALLEDKADAAVIAEPPPDDRVHRVLIDEQRVDGDRDRGDRGHENAE